MGGPGFFEAGRDAGVVGDVDAAKDPADRLGDGVAAFFVEVEQRNFGALRGEAARSAFSEGPRRLPLRLRLEN